MTDPLKFLQKIWRIQADHLPTGAKPYAGLSHKDWETGEWRDYPQRWLVTELPLTNDLYFAPNLFSGRGRTKTTMLPSRWLYADLDEVDPQGLGDLAPTVAWETSPGRYQGLWLADRPLKLAPFENLNRRLTYATGADKGGWSATKVLRVPGTVSTKYGKSRAKRFTVALCGTGEKYTVEELQQLLPRLDRPKSLGKLFGQLDDLPDRRKTLEHWRPKLPIRARKLLSTRTIVRGDDRSARLWELYNLLLQAGMTPDEVLVSVQGTKWNKYAGQRREIERLTQEITKAAEKHADSTELNRLQAQREGRSSPAPKGAVGRRLAKRQAENGDVLPYLTNSEFLQQQFPEPEWLVEGIWSKNAYGIWAGEYKAYKTVTLLDFAVSVASGVPFLGRFNVREPGGVLYLHEEGQRGLIRDRLHRIEYNKGLAAKIGETSTGEVLLEAPPDLDHLHISSFPGFKITDEDSQKKLVNYAAKVRPRAVIMEAFYLIAGDIDENSAKEVAPALDFLSTVAREYQFALIISHHYNKASTDPGVKKRSANRVSGSSVFGRWYESAVFIERIGDEDEYAARMEAQHREQKGSGKLDLMFEMDVENEDNYNVTIIDKDNSTVRVNDPATVEVDLAPKYGPGGATRRGTGVGKPLQRKTKEEAGV